MLLICSTGAAIVGWILVGGACVPSIFLEEVKLQLKVSSAADMIFKAVNLIMILAAPGESPPPPSPCMEVESLQLKGREYINPPTAAEKALISI